MVRVHPPAATPNVRDPFRVAGEGPGATTHPRTPAPNIVIGSSGILARGRVCAYGLPCDRHLVFFIFYCNLIRFRPLASLLPSSSFCPSSAYRESLGHRYSRSAPFCPSHPGLPFCPGILGLRAGATSRRPSSGEGGWVALPITPPGEAPVGPGEVQEHHPPHPGGHGAAVPRRLSSAFPILPLAPLGSCPGDWDTAAAGPGGRNSHEASSLADLRRRPLRLDKKLHLL